MNVYTTTTTFATIPPVGSTQDITPGFQAKAVHIEAAPANGMAFQGIQFSSGWSDLTRKKCDYMYLNPANGRAICAKTTSKLLQVWGEDAMGNLVVVLEIAINSVTATKVKFDVLVANPNIQVSIKVEG